MKTIILDQPWASLIVNGISDIANVDSPTQHSGMSLIASSDKKIDDDFFEQIPVEYSATIGNHILMGNLPQLDQMPLNSIIGCADLVGESTEIDDDTSMWGLGPVMWQFDNIRAFETATTLNGSNRHSNIIDADDKISHEPSHCPSIRMPHIENGELIIPLSAQYFDQIMALDHKFVNFEIAHSEIADILLADAEKYLLNRFATVRLISNDSRSTRFTAHPDTAVQAYLDDCGNPIMVPTLWSPQPIPWLVAHIAMGKELQ